LIPTFPAAYATRVRTDCASNVLNLTQSASFATGAWHPTWSCPRKLCFPVSDSISPTRAALAEPLSGVCHALDSLKPSVGESAVIIGAGPIGLSFCAVLDLAGVSPIVAVEPVASRRETAMRMGASLSLDPTHPDLERTIRDQLGGDGPDLVVDAVGSQFSLAVRLAGSRARVLLFGINDRSVADASGRYHAPRACDSWRRGRPAFLSGEHSTTRGGPAGPVAHDLPRGRARGLADRT
jgi:threonine dehydrogenase-like Zn-dependent dehydrogenase